MAKPGRKAKKANHGKRPANSKARKTQAAPRPHLSGNRVPVIGKERTVAKKQLILDLSEYDLNHVVADIEEIRRYNPQRFEMEQLTAICFEDTSGRSAWATRTWARTSFGPAATCPACPLMPGVIMCEAAAQLAAYYARR